MDDNIKLRLQKILEEKNDTPNSLSVRTGFSQRTLNRQIKEKTAVGYDVISLFASSYPDISLDWLITGKGEMFKNTYQNVSEKLPVAAEPITSYSSLKDEHFEVLRENRMLRKEIEELRKKMAKTA